jgi:hypothetical protein
MDDARTYFNDETMDKLDNIIQPHTLGIESTDFSEVKYGERKNIIFNHRGQHYMGWGWFCKAMDELWKRRQDFKVLTFQRDANGVKYPWTDYQSPLNLNRDDYFKRMKQDGYIGVGCFTSSKGGGGASWSISITDLLSLGVPCVLPNKFVYPSLVGDNYPLLYKSQNQDEFLTQIENVLDNPKLRQKSVNHLKPIMTKMKWTSQVKSWMDWDKFFDPHSFKMVGENAGGYDKMVNIIKQNKKITTGQLKSQLGWGVSFKTGSYRNRLRIDNRIKFTTNGYEWVG